MEHYYRTRMAAVEEAVEVDVLESERIQAPWHVILFNDEIHTFDEVVLQVMKATGCSSTQAEAVTMEAHTKGQAGVHTGDMERCLEVSSILGEIGLLTEIRG